MDAAREGRAAVAGRCTISSSRTGLALLIALLSSTAASVEAQDTAGVRGIPQAQDTTRASAFSLEGLVVTAAPTTLEEDAVSSHVTVLDADDLGRFGDRSLAEALRDVPGVQVVRGGSFGAVTSLFLRGGESDYTLVLVDGVQVNTAGGGFDFAELTTDGVERIEIVRGPASALYGSDAVSGVIHVITRTGRGAPTSTVSVRSGSFGRLDLSADVRAGGERASYGVSVARHASEGVLDLNNQTAHTVLSGAARFRPDDLTRLGVNLRVSGREYHFPTNSAGEVVDRNAFTFSDGVTAGISATRELTPRLSLEASVGMNEIDGGTDDAVDGPADTLGFFGFTSLDHFRRSVGEVRTHLRVNPVTLTAGFEYEEERQRSFSESMSQFGTSTGRSESTRRNLGYFAHATGESGRISYQVGARLEDNERFGTSGTWQVGVASPIPGSGVVRASVGTAIKEPTFFENFASGFVTGNPDLEPERSLAWEMGVEQPLLGMATARVTWFEQSFENLIQYTAAPPEPDDPNYFNVAAAESRGVEAELDVRRGSLSGGGSLTWTDTEVTDSGFDGGAAATFVAGEPLLRRPTWEGSVRGALVLGRADLSARLRHVGERHDRDFSTFPASPVTLDAYRLLSVAVDVSLLDGAGGDFGFTLELRGENLLDETYEEVFGFRGPGRGFYVGGRVGLGG